VTQASAIDSERRAQLEKARLATLVRERFGVSDADPGTAIDAATLVSGATGWFAPSPGKSSALGPALAWARQQGVSELHVIAENDAGVIARRAGAFAAPPVIWAVQGRELSPARPVPHEPLPEPPGDIDHLVDLLLDAGAEVVVEHGVVTGEILGLEVARVVVEGDAAPRLDVGVGRHDREAFTMMHGEVPTPVALERVVSAVREQRRPGAASHPLTRLSRARWLRSTLRTDPARVGLVSMRSIPGIDPVTDLRNLAPAAALGVDAEGASILVVCSVGIDLELVPVAADLRAREASEAGEPRIVLVMPERDAQPVTRALAEQLTEPAQVVPVEGEWGS
jgi:hypothetical protein